MKSLGYVKVHFNVVLVAAEKTKVEINDLIDEEIENCVHACVEKNLKMPFVRLGLKKPTDGSVFKRFITIASSGRTPKYEDQVDICYAGICNKYINRIESLYDKLDECRKLKLAATLAQGQFNEFGGAKEELQFLLISAEVIKTLFAGGMKE